MDYQDKSPLLLVYFFKFVKRYFMFLLKIDQSSPIEQSWWPLLKSP